MLEKIPAAIGHALQGVRPGLDALIYARADLAAPESLTLTSPAFAADGLIQAAHTADGAGRSPPLDVAGVPDAARSLVLIVEDADSPTPAPLCHLLAWNIDATASSLPEGALDDGAAEGSRATLGKNSFMKSGWLPPDPPTGHGAHRYCFQLYALDCALDLAEGSGRGELAGMLAGHLVGKAMLIGTYARPD